LLKGPTWCEMSRRIDIQDSIRWLLYHQKYIAKLKNRYDREAKLHTIGSMIMSQQECMISSLTLFYYGS
jgi:hypothetical protein